jgi:hypothetical protein
LFHAPHAHSKFLRHIISGIPAGYPQGQNEASLSKFAAQLLACMSSHKILNKAMALRFHHVFDFIH